MANALWTPAKEGLIAGEIDMDTAVIKAALVRSYTFAASHKFVSDLTTAGGVLAATSAALASKTVTGGVFDAADVTFTAPAANASQHVVIIFQSSAVTGGSDVAATAQRLIAHYDTGTGLPIPSLNGGDVTVAWDNGANKIYAVT